MKTSFGTSSFSGSSRPTAGMRKKPAHSVASDPVPCPAIENGPAGKAGMASHGRHRERCLSAGFWPAITRRQSPPSPLPRLLALAADECGLWLETAAPAKPARPLLVCADESAPSARDPEARRHYWMGHYP